MGVSIVGVSEGVYLNIALHYAMLFCVMLCYVMLCYVMLCYVMLCYHVVSVMLWHVEGVPRQHPCK